MFTIAHALGAGIEPGQFPLGPIIAAAIVSATLGRAGLRQWGQRLITLRAAPAWYAIALLAPIVILAAAVLANAAFGAPLPSSAQLGEWTGLGEVFLGMLIAIGIGEEAGWTAFAAPLLLERHRFVRAWLILGAVRSLWHLPMMLQGDLSWTLGIGGNFAFQLLVLWLYRRTGSWFLAALWHATLNTVGGSFLFRMVEGADQERLGLLMVAGYWLAAIAVLVLDRRNLNLRPESANRTPVGPAS
jgi:membrane protease YdiL (CAAX protease family)